MNELRRRFDCCGASVWVSLAAIRTDEGELRFSVDWQPARPARLSLADIAHFDRMRFQAVADIRREYEAITSC